MDAAVAGAVQKALGAGEVLAEPPQSPQDPTPPSTADVESEEGEVIEEEPMSEDEEPTEEDLRFINDGKAELAEEDTAGVDTSNIITGKRTRRAPTRWEHPDSDLVMRQYMKRSGITEEDLEIIEASDEEEGEPDDEDDPDEILDAEGETTSDYSAETEGGSEGGSEDGSDFESELESDLDETDEEVDDAVPAAVAPVQANAAQVTPQALADPQEDVVVARPAKKRRAV
jgi:hypothetical protein